MTGRHQESGHQVHEGGGYTDEVDKVHPFAWSYH